MQQYSNSGPDRAWEMPAALLVAISLTVTAIAAALCYLVADGIALTGIDDAAITRNYAENIANGAGFVYYDGGERVEGATSFLWTGMLAAVYAVTERVEIPILLLSAGCVVLYIYALLRVILILAARFDIPAVPAVLATCGGLIVMPSFFYWSVFSMMETALWGACVMLLVWRLVRFCEDGGPDRGLMPLSAALLPLIRPEGVAVALGLLVFTWLLRPKAPRLPLLSAAAALVSLGAVTGFRLVYFGFPFPNTYYAKVSSDRVESLVAGVKYFLAFALELPFANILIVAAALLAVWSVARMLQRRPEGAAGSLICAAALFGFFATYAMLGGDHFIYWRMYQPVLPVLLVAPSLAVGAIAAFVHDRTTEARSVVVALALVAVLGLTAIAYGDFRRERFLLRSNFALVEQGVSFGRLMNELAPGTVIGVGPAGGIALSYDGPIRDLFGLNWVEMAHANPLKSGLSGHSSFDRDVFWADPPDMVAEFNRPCRRDDWSWAFSLTEVVVFKGLFLEPAFQKRYAPVRIADGNRCWRTFATAAWVEAHADPRIEPASWSDLTLR